MSPGTWTANRWSSPESRRGPSFIEGKQQIKGEQMSGHQQRTDRTSSGGGTAQGESLRRIDRRQFLKESTAIAAALGTGLHVRRARAGRGGNSAGKQVIVLGFDGMDPGLTEQMMDAGQLPHLAGLRKTGSYRRIGTTIPPQTPVAFSTFITGTNPGGHGIYDFIHRDPARQSYPMFSAAGTSRGIGYWEVGDHKLQLDFWPFGHKPPATILQRKGTPFWDHLDAAGIPAHIFEVPSNFPPSDSRHGNHRAIAGLGTPDLRGGYGTYQHFAQDGPFQPLERGGGIQSRLLFADDAATHHIRGPENTFLKNPQETEVEFTVYRDRQANAALIEIQGRRILLEAGQWSEWIRLDFTFRMPNFMPDQHQSGIVRFYLQEVAPVFRLYVTPINIDPSDPVMKISEPEGYIRDVSKELGLFYTAGFQEDYQALRHGVFSDEEYLMQTEIVLEERKELLEHALKHYDDGMLFFYFACTDLQPHMFYWDSDEPHPVRGPEEAKKYHNEVKHLYQKMDAIVGDILNRYSDQATIMVMSDHGMANFKRQFSLNRWLRDNGYIRPDDATHLETDVDWSQTRAFGIGLNGLYLNLKGRERDGIVDPGREREDLLAELIAGLEAVKDEDGRPVIKKVFRGDEVYFGAETALAPDLVIGYHRRFRCSWETAMGAITEEVLADNDLAWSADHCLAPDQVPGVLFCNRPMVVADPTLLDLAPTILAEFGLPKPDAMTGRDLLSRTSST